MTSERLSVVRLKPPLPPGARLWAYPWVGLGLGAVAAVFMGHPISMLVYNIHSYVYGGAPLNPGGAFLESFSLHMWPMILLYALVGSAIGVVIGAILKRLREHRLRLDTFHQEFELQVATLRHHYKNLALGIHGFSSRVKRKLGEIEEKICQCSIEDPAYQNLHQDVQGLTQNLSVLEDAAERLTRTLGQELLFLKILTSDSLKFEPLDFYPLLVACVKDLRGMRFREKEVQVAINGQPPEECRDSLVFPFEPYTMEVMLHNIIGNAMKYGDAIQVRVQDAGDRVRVTVEDNGRGVDVVELQQSLLTPRERHDAESTHLGLKVTLHLLQKCGGNLLVASRPGAGAVFALEFPKA